MPATRPQNAAPTLKIVTPEAATRKVTAPASTRLAPASSGPKAPRRLAAKVGTSASPAAASTMPCGEAMTIATRPGRDQPEHHVEAARDGRRPPAPSRVRTGLRPGRQGGRDGGEVERVGRRSRRPARCRRRSRAWSAAPERGSRSWPARRCPGCSARPSSRRTTAARSRRARPARRPGRVQCRCGANWSAPIDRTAAEVKDSPNATSIASGAAQRRANRYAASQTSTTGPTSCGALGRSSTGARQRWNSTPASIAEATCTGISAIQRPSWAHTPTRASSRPQTRNEPTASGQPPCEEPVATNRAAPGVDQATTTGMPLPDRENQRADAHQDRDRRAARKRPLAAWRPRPAARPARRRRLR